MDFSVTIVIPCQKMNKYTRECIKNCLKLDYDHYEILVLPDDNPSENFDGVKIIATGDMGPADKRDMAAEIAEGEILAFIDDDAYPTKSWLKNAVQHFHNDEIGAVVGPNVTPESDGLRQKATGAVYASFMRLRGGAQAILRILPSQVLTSMLRRLQDPTHRKGGWRGEKE